MQFYSTNKLPLEIKLVGIQVHFSYFYESIIKKILNPISEPRCQFWNIWLYFNGECHYSFVKGDMTKRAVAFSSELFSCFLFYFGILSTLFRIKGKSIFFFIINHKSLLNTTQNLPNLFYFFFTFSTKRLLVLDCCREEFLPSF